MMKELICIVCPKGCHLKVDETNDYSVTGNSCLKGAEYGHKELVNPTRTITTTVQLLNSKERRVSVKTSCDVAKDKIFEIMQIINQVQAKAPLHRGDVLIKHICQSDADLIVTKDVD